MGMAAGRLDRRIELLVHGISYDGHNQPIAAWSMLATVSASVRRATVRERLASGQVGAQATEIFEIRWSPDVAALNSKDRIGYEGRVYDIVGVVEIGRREGMTITAAVRIDG